MLFLRHWWSEHYNRPLKDPMLDSYTLEELTYEYYDKIERHKAAEDGLEEESDRIENEALQENLTWAEEEERKEREEMLKQLELDKAKQEYGDDYGEDIDIEFSE